MARPRPKSGQVPPPPGQSGICPEHNVSAINLQLHKVQLQGPVHQIAMLDTVDNHLHWRSVYILLSFKSFIPKLHE